MPVHENPILFMGLSFITLKKSTNSAWPTLKLFTSHWKPWGNRRRWRVNGFMLLPWRNKNGKKTQEPKGKSPCISSIICDGWMSPTLPIVLESGKSPTPCKFSSQLSQYGCMAYNMYIYIFHIYLRVMLLLAWLFDSLQLNAIHMSYTKLFRKPTSFQGSALRPLRGWHLPYTAGTL